MYQQGNKTDSYMSTHIKLVLINCYTWKEVVLLPPGN